MQTDHISLQADGTYDSAVHGCRICLLRASRVGMFTIMPLLQSRLTPDTELFAKFLCSDPTYAHILLDTVAHSPQSAYLLHVHCRWRCCHAGLRANALSANPQLRYKHFRRSWRDDDRGRTGHEPRCDCPQPSLDASLLDPYIELSLESPGHVAAPLRHQIERRATVDHYVWSS